MITIGNVHFVLDAVPSDPADDVIVRDVDGDFPSGAVAAGVYRIDIPSLRRGPFPAGIRIAGNASLEAEGDLTTTLSLAPQSQLPEWTVIDPPNIP